MLESGTQGEGAQVFQLQERTEEHTVQQPTILLAILSKMAQKPEVQFDTLFQKLYNVELWPPFLSTDRPQAGKHDRWRRWENNR